MSVRQFVCLCHICRPLQQSAAGLLLSVRRAADIDRLLPGAERPASAAPQQHGVAAANAGSATLTADVGS